jgi:hypothetical protein
MEESDALRKAQGLLNKSMDATVSEEERELLQAKAFDIIKKFGIDEAMLNAKADVKQKPVQKDFFITGAQAKYRVNAFANIGEACHCRVLTQNFGDRWVRNQRRVIVFGFESDVAVLEMLWTSLQLQGMKEVAQIKDERPKYEQYYDKNQTKAMRNSFWQGFGQQIAKRLIEAEQKVSEPGTDLVLYDRSKAVDEAVDAAFSKLKKPDPYQVAHSEGFFAGVVAGQRANIHDKAEVQNKQRELT